MPWPHWKMVRRVYFTIPILAFPALPLMLSEAIVMGPSLMFYLLGIGPILGTAQLPIKCRICGAIVEPPSTAPSE